MRYGGVLTIVNPDPPSTFDYHQASRIDVWLPFSNVYIGLLRHDPVQTDEVIPLMASGWEVSSDGKEYIFTLHPGIRWHDGRPLTTEDVAWSLNRMAFPPKGVISPRGGDVLTGMVKAEAMDASRVRVTLNAPSATFIERVATDWALIMPKHLLQQKQGDALDIAVGSGPFKFVRYNPNVSIELTKNKDYFVPARPYLDGITVFIIPDDRTAFAALRTGRVLLTTVGSRAISPTEAELVESDPELSKKIRVERYPTTTKLAVIFNLTTPPWNDIKLRQAVSLAVDRQAAVKVARTAMLAGPFIPGARWGLPLEELQKRPGYRQPKDQDIAEAKRLLAEAGYPKGFNTSLMCRAGEDCDKFAALVKADLAKIGINVQIAPSAANVVTEKLNKKEYRIVVYRHASALVDPSIFFIENYLTNAGRNYAGFSDAQVDQWIKELDRVQDANKRAEIVRKLQGRVFELQPAVDVFFYQYLRGRWRRLEGFNSGPGLWTEGNLEYAWLREQAQ